MGIQIAALTQAVAAAEIKVNELRDDESALRHGIGNQTETIKKADAILAGPYLYRDHMEAQSTRAAALRERAEASTALNRITVDIGRASTRLAELRRDLARTQYEAVTDADLKRVQVETISAIRAIDSQLADLQRDWVALVEKRDAALKVAEVLTTAESELIDVRQALETQQADAFIDGNEADLTGHKAKETKAQKKVDEAKVDAIAAVAALPRIAQRLESLNDDIETTSAERVAAVAAYWANRQTLLERKYLMHAHGLMDALQALLAVTRITGNGLGHQLLDKMRRAVYIPVEGKHSEPLNTAPWFGHEVIPDVSAAQAHLNTEFDAAIAKQL